jgi:hypothetical protein
MPPGCPSFGVMMPLGYNEFNGTWGSRAQLALDTVAMKPTRRIPAWMLHVMDVPFMEQATGHAPGDYVKAPDDVYLAFQRLAGACYIDQYIPDNPLTMTHAGFECTAERTATTGAAKIVLDGIRIDSPEAVLEHMERVVFPRRAERIRTRDPDDPSRIESLITAECSIQRRFGSDILKGPYSDGFQAFPIFHNYTYGYENYFMAYALYPEVMAKDFAQQADLAALDNMAAAKAIVKGALPRLIRLDYDMADSRGMLVDIRSLDAIWFPHFVRAIRPFLDAGIRLIWHCDGNLMALVPRLIEAGIGGFQGFQYEDGMDYERICRMTDRNGDPLFILAGVSVTRTMPFGTPKDIREEMKWLVANGPKVGLMLGGSSTVAPGVPHENIRTVIEGLRYYQEHGR